MHMHAWRRLPTLPACQPLPCRSAKWKGRGKKKKGKKSAEEDLYGLLGLQNEVRCARWARWA